MKEVKKEKTWAVVDWCGLDILFRDCSLSQFYRRNQKGDIGSGRPPGPSGAGEREGKEGRAQAWRNTLSRPCVAPSARVLRWGCTEDHLGLLLTAGCSYLCSVRLYLT